MSGNGVDITNGDSTPGSFDHTDFGNAQASVGNSTRTFTITNGGDTTLSLDGNPRVALGGLHAADFTVTPSFSKPNKNHYFLA